MAACMGAVLFACNLSKTGELVVFDTETTKRSSIVSQSGAEFEMKDSLLRIVTQGNEDGYPGVVINGKWNLTGFYQVKIEMVNFDKKGNLPITVRFANAGADPGKGKGVFIDRLVIPEGESKEFVLTIPSQLPYPEIQEKLFGMRNTPYKRQGLASDLNPSEVSSVSFYINKPKLKWNWGIKKVTAIPGTPEKLPSWMELPPDKFFPFIDEFGQFIHKEWPGKTKSVEDMQAALQEEMADLEANPGPKDRDQYSGWANGPKQKATGHFYVKKVDGKWWMVDPEGNLYWSHAPVRVTPSSAVTPLDNREFYFKDLPAEGSPLAQFYTTHDTLLYPYYVKRGIKKTYDFSSANIMRKYGDNWRQKYNDIVHRRLKSWGLTTIANSSDRSICLMDRTPYCDRFELKSPDIEGSRDGWWKFKDPFHPEFRTTFRKQLLERKKELDDPWSIGFFVDNEIAWGAPGALAEWTLQSPSSQPAKQEMVNRLKKKYKNIGELNKIWKSDYESWDALLASQKKPAEGSRDDCISFSEVLAEAYFKNVRDEFKSVAPDKLYMGCRFAGGNAIPEILKIAAKYCDIISYNIYRHSLADFKLPEGVDKPLMIGEFHFGALDRGLFHPGLVQTANQAERAEAYKTYVESALRHPNFVGTHWHQFSDQATTGRFDGENFQVGFIDVCDRPYPETIAKIREVGYKMYEIRSSK